MKRGVLIIVIIIVIVILVSLAINFFSYIIFVGIMLFNPSSVYILNDVPHVEIEPPFLNAHASGTLDKISLLLEHEHRMNLTILSAEVKNCGINSNISTFKTRAGYSDSAESGEADYTSIKVDCCPLLGTGWETRKIKILYKLTDSPKILTASGTAVFKITNDDIYSFPPDSFVFTRNEFITEKITPLIKQAIEKKDPEFCKEVIEAYYKEIRDMSLKQNLTSKCDNSNKEKLISYYKDYLNYTKSESYELCMTQMAVSLNDQVLCSRTKLRYGLEDKNLSLKDLDSTYLPDANPLRHLVNTDCVEKVILKNYNEECELIENESLKKECVKDAAFENNDALTCKKINDNQCIYDIALKNKDSDVCKYIGDMDLNDFCNRDVSKIIIDPKSCMQIEGVSSWGLYINRTCV